MVRYYPDELMHFGIKGMKWGVRRYQNKDGTRTPLGKAREREGNGTGKKIAKGAGAAAGVLAGANLLGRAVTKNGQKSFDKESAKEYMTKRDPQQNNTTEFDRTRKLVDDAFNVNKARSLRSKKEEAARRKKYRGEARGLSDSDLKARVSRLNLEKQYVDLSSGRDTDGNWSYADNVTLGYNTVNDLITFGLGAAALYGSLRKVVR